MRTTGKIRLNHRLINIGAALVFLMVVGAMVLGRAVPPLVLYIYLGASVLTYIMYAADKKAAQHDAHRIAENKLHLLALLGGWPGAILAQQIHRHKTQKGAFRLVFWVTVAVNCAALVWLLTPYGEPALQWLGARL